MRTKFFVILTCLLVSGLTAQQYQSGAVRPKIAVYVSEHGGYSREQKSALRTAALNTLVRSGAFHVIERSDVIETELLRQTSGAIDDDQLTAFGRQLGARFVCVADMTFLRRRVEKCGDNRTCTYNDHQVSARIIDVETAEVLALGVVDADISNGVQMSQAIVRAVEKMMGTVQPAKSESMPQIAVYVLGGGERTRRSNNNASNALYSYTLEALFTRSRYNKDFRVVERSEAFTRQIDREQITQRSGHVDDGQITRLGRQYGIERILVASIEHSMNTYNISARIVNVETATVENASRLYHTGSDLGGLRSHSVSMVEDLIKRVRAQSELEAERTGWMASVGLGGGMTFPMSAIDSVYYNNIGGAGSLDAEFYKNHRSFFRFGCGLEIGGVGVDKDLIKEEHPNVNTDSIKLTSVGKLGGFARLYPVNALYLSGGFGIGWYNHYSAKTISGDKIRGGTNVIAPVVSLGGGLSLTVSKDGDGSDFGFYTDAQYNIIPLSDRVTNHWTVKLGIKFIGISLNKPPEI